MSASIPSTPNTPSRPARDVTSHDVARAAGVSQSTVSRALRNDSRVTEATKERVRAAVAQLGYVPSDVGRSLVTRSTRTIAIVVTDLTSVFYPYLVGPLHDEVAARGYRMVLFTERLEAERDPAIHLTNGRDGEAPPIAADGEDPTSAEISPLLDRLLDRSVDGVVLTTSRLDGSVPSELTRRSLPFVFLTRFVDGVAADLAVVDNSLGASLAAAEAIRLGHRRFGAIFGPADTSTGRDRERGVRAGLAAAHLELAPADIRRGPFTFEAGFDAMTELLGHERPPTVVLCSNDTVAIGALNAAASLNRAVPEDVSIVGFDDLPMASWPIFNLTTVRQPIEEMARTAVDLLIDRIEGQLGSSTVRQRVFEPSMVIRGTLGPPRSERN
jgi:LacI family transcriptional regulator